MTEDRVFESLVQLSTILKQYFPMTPIIPALGNHDFHPLNYFNTNEPNQESIALISNFWSVFIGDDPAAMQEF